MNVHKSPAPAGRVDSIHLHPKERGAPLRSAEGIELVAGKGIVGDERCFGRLSRTPEKPSRRQVTLIEREQIAEHAVALGLEKIAPGAVRSNIETRGINLISLLGRQIQIGTAVLFLYEPREPCPRMDAICPGLRARMMNNRQGVLAEIVRSGSIRCGDAITVLEIGATGQIGRAHV